MATTKEFHDFILENLQKVGEVSTRKMMGDICDNCLFLKPTASVLRLLPDAERAYPYEGSKTLMVMVEDVEDTALMKKLLEGMYGELPEPKKKKAKSKGAEGQD